MLLQSFDQQFLRETATNPLLYHGMRQLAMVEIIADVAVGTAGLVLALPGNWGCVIRDRPRPSAIALSIIPGEKRWCVVPRAIAIIAASV